MKRTEIKWTNSTSTKIITPIIARNVVEDFVIPKFSAYNNLTYLRTIDDSNFVEAVFQIGNNTGVYLKVGKLNGNANNQYNQSGLINFALSNNATAKQNYLTPNTDYTSFFPGNDFFMSTLMYEVTDNNNNLKALWHLRPSWSSTNSGQYISPLIITKTLSNEDIGIIFEHNNGGNASVYYLNDANHVRYRLKWESSLFSSVDKVLRKTAYITSNDSSGSSNPSVVDGINNEFLNIINSDLQAQITYDTSQDYTKKLIKMGTNEDLYRQLASQWWIADPKGDETPATVDIVYDGT